MSLVPLIGLYLSCRVIRSWPRADPPGRWDSALRMITHMCRTARSHAISYRGQNCLTHVLVMVDTIPVSAVSGVPKVFVSRSGPSVELSCRLTPAPLGGARKPQLGERAALRDVTLSHQGAPFAQDASCRELSTTSRSSH